MLSIFIVEYKKTVELKSKGYRAGIERKDRDGIAHLELLTLKCFTPYKSMM